MKVLITSGGTIVPIDRVRRITNMSSGTFGRRIAIEFLQHGHDVFFYRAKESKAPFRTTLDFFRDGESAMTEAEKTRDLWRTFKGQYNECTYDTYDRYADGLSLLCGSQHPDVIVLAAAVSDYGVANYVNGKIRSADNFTIQLKELEKLIGKIKNQWGFKGKLVGFKLLVDSADYKLIEAAQKSIKANGCDLVVANDLQDIKDNNHRLQLVFPDGTVKQFKQDQQDEMYLARMVVEQTQQL